MRTPFDSRSMTFTPSLGVTSPSSANSSPFPGAQTGHGGNVVCSIMAQFIYGNPYFLGNVILFILCLGNYYIQLLVCIIFLMLTKFVSLMPFADYIFSMILLL